MKKTTPHDTAMFAIAVGDALASAWGENDPAIDKVVRAVNAHDSMLDALEMVERNFHSGAGITGMDMLRVEAAIEKAKK